MLRRITRKISSSVPLSLTLALGFSAATFFGPGLLKGEQKKAGHNLFDVDR